MWEIPREAEGSFLEVGNARVSNEKDAIPATSRANLNTLSISIPLTLAFASFLLF